MTRNYIGLKSSALLLGLMLAAEYGYGQGIYSFTDLVVENDATLYVDEDVVNNSGASIENAGTIRVKGDWTNNGTSTVGATVVLEGSDPQLVQGTNDFTGVFQIENTHPGGATISPSGLTNVHGILRLSEGVINTNEKLVIASTEFGTTGLVDDFSHVSYDGSISGDLRVQRYISDGGVLDGNTFHYIGPPVVVGNIGSNLDELGLYGPDGGQLIPEPDCNPDQLNIYSPYGALFEWHEDGPFLYPGCTQSGWYVRRWGALQNGRGYAAIAADVTIEMKGPVNTAENGTASVTYSGLGNTDPTGDGWHLVSNPFPSPIIWDLNTYSQVSGFEGGISFYQPNGQYSGTYVPRVPVQGEVIPSMQGFMAHIASGTGVTWALDQTSRVIGDPGFWKTDGSNEFDLIVKTGPFADKTTIRFGLDGETNSFDQLFDARKFPSKANQPTLSTIMDDVSLGINSMNLDEHPMTIPLNLVPGTSGTFSIEADGLESFTAEAHVYIEDLREDKIQELTVNPVYSFSADESDDPDRFLIHFRLNGEEPMYTTEDVTIYAHDQTAYIFIPEYDGNAQLEVFNTLGELVFQTSQLSEGRNEIVLDGLPTGTYIIRALVNDRPISKKVVF